MHEPIIYMYSFLLLPNFPMYLIMVGSFLDLYLNIPFILECSLSRRTNSAGGKFANFPTGGAAAAVIMLVLMV